MFTRSSICLYIHWLDFQSYKRAASG